VPYWVGSCAIDRFRRSAAAACALAAAVWMLTGARPALAQREPEPPATTADAAKYPGLTYFESTVPPWFPKLLGAQITTINQNQFPFHSAFSGPNSLNQGGENKTSQTRSAYFGSQITDNLEFYVDAEWFVGDGLHGGSGLAGYPNVEVIRAGSNLPKNPYLARYYAQYVLPLAADRFDFVRGIDQLPGPEPSQYLIAKFGKMATSDDFDNNRYANSGRTQFMNFALVNNGAWDFAADTRGFTYGAMLGIVRSDWALKFGSYAMPTTANGVHYDTDFAKDHGDNLEFTYKGLPNDAIVRFLAYANHGRMANYDRVIDQARALGVTPNVTQFDNVSGHLKYGFGINAEVPLADNGDTGVFFRGSWNDGRTATWAFTEIDRSLSAGGQLSGIHWGRENDWVGLGLVANFLSDPHRRYLSAGGVGFAIGDGGLVNYRPEEILETYYNAEIRDWLRAGPDYQYIQNPAYNADRGPVHIVSFRLRAAM
jgi:high affinity Mn2+ porin